MLDPKMKMDEVRDLLNNIANQLDQGDLADPARVASELRFIAERIKRRPVVRRSPNQCQPLDPHKVRTIRYLFQKNPTMSLQAIATAIGCNIGRVSEVLHGGPRT